MSRSNKSTTSSARLRQDYLRLKRDPVPYITAEPLPQNIFEWHYVVKGPEDSPYFGGYYHGTLVFPREFPFKPPSIYMLTPNGRFQTNTRLCLSISDFHPDTWNPAWSVATILTGLLSFMLETTPTLGSTECTTYQREQFAKRSLRFNVKNETFKELFPDIVKEIQQKLMAHEFSINNPNANGIGGGQAYGGVAGDSGGHGAGTGPDAIGGGGGGGGAPVAFNDTFNSFDDRHPFGGPRHNQSDGSTWQSLCSNLIVLVGFGLFAYVVNHVIKNLNQE